MTDPSRRNLAASVHQRLMNHARTHGLDANHILTRYATERLLYRLAQSPHADQFILKGATMFLIWTRNPYRPTMDLDLLGHGEDSIARLTGVFQNCCTLAVEPDGMAYDATRITITATREGQEYPGKRIGLIGGLGNGRIPLQVDIGFGDVVSPRPEPVTMPTLLDFPAPALHAITRESAIAEKVHALVVLGMGNTRMKDFADIRELARHCAFSGPVLATAIAATFTRRVTPLPVAMPLALTDAFATDRSKQMQWTAFCRKSRIAAVALTQVVMDLAAFLLPVMRPEQPVAFDASWPPGGPWRGMQRDAPRSAG